MLCPTCNARRVLAIGVHLGDTDVVLHSCSVCENRWWEENGQVIQLTDVLELATVRR